MSQRERQKRESLLDVIEESVIPKELDIPEFVKAWTMFCQHRIEIKKPLTATAIVLLMRNLKAAGTYAAIAAMEESIINGWQGVFIKKGSEVPDRLCEPFDALWKRWIQARRAARIHTDPARGKYDQANLEEIGIACKTGGEYSAVFRAYCEDESDDYITKIGWPLAQLPRRMNLYSGAINVERQRMRKDQDHIGEATEMLDQNDDVIGDMTSLKELFGEIPL